MSIGDWRALAPHPAAKLVREMDESEYAALLASVKESGCLEAIVLHDGMVLDGVHRLRACVEAGVEPRLVEWMGSMSPEQYVLSVNVARRHLTPSQRAAYAAERMGLYKAEAAAREQAGTLAHNCARVGKAAEQAAEDLGVSPRYVEAAAKIMAEQPDQFSAVKAGKTTVSSVIAAVAALKAAKELSEAKRGKLLLRLQTEPQELELRLLPKSGGVGLSVGASYSRLSEDDVHDVVAALTSAVESI